MTFFDWIGITAPGKPLAPGDPAPDVLSRNEQGRDVRLADFYAKGTTLVYFFPKADTPGCTDQACSLRDDFTALSECDLHIVGVSADRPEAQLRFKERHRLPFSLLADEDGSVARAFGVPLIFGMTRRQSFLIQAGRVVWRDLHASTRRQAQDILAALVELS